MTKPAKKLNSNQAKFLANILGGMKRVDAYMDAYDIEDERRLAARKLAYQLIATNNDIKAKIDKANETVVERAEERFYEEYGDTLDMYFILRDEAKAEHSVRFRVCQDHINRMKGLPKISMEHSGEINSDVTFNFGGKIKEDDL